jgi:hypothetical protein
VPDPLILCKGPGLERTSSTNITREFFSFDLLPFAAPNSHWTPKFRHSLTFPLLPNYPRATLPHGRPSPRPNPEAPSPSTRRIVPPLPPTIQYPPLPTHSPHANPFPLITYIQATYFHALTHSFAQRRAAIPFIPKSLRTLSIATGVYSSDLAPCAKTQKTLSVTRKSPRCHSCENTREDVPTADTNFQRCPFGETFLGACSYISASTCRERTAILASKARSGRKEKFRHELSRLSIH